MSYVNDTVLPGENIVLKAQIHWIIFMPTVFLFLLAGLLYYQFNQVIIAFVVNCFAFVAAFRAFIYYFTTELAVTDHRVLAKFGWIRRNTFELNIERVTSLSIQQSVLGRILNYGNVQVNGMGGDITPIPAIYDPLKFRHQVLGEVGAKEDKALIK